MLEVGKQYSISEVAELTSYPPHVLRYYEKEFELVIPRNESNHRYYTYMEIELFQYIKSLQEKGFSNKQIKLILKSPDILLNNTDETALTNISPQDNSSIAELAKEISICLQGEFFKDFKGITEDTLQYNEQMLKELLNEITELRNEINSKERDVLVCENAKLKMKVKEKSYEIINLREKLKKTENNRGFFYNLFKK